METVEVTNGLTIGDAVQAGGEGYELDGDNCQDAADRIMAAAKK